MVATLHPPSTGIAPQYSLPLRLGTGVAQPTLLEHTATVLVKQPPYPPVPPWRLAHAHPTPSITNSVISPPPPLPPHPHHSFATFNRPLFATRFKVTALYLMHCCSHCGTSSLAMLFLRNIFAFRVFKGMGSLHFSVCSPPCGWSFGDIFYYLQNTT